MIPRTTIANPQFDEFHLIRSWYREGLPKDYEPGRPGDYRKSSYVRLGQDEDPKTHWVSQTHQSMAEGRGDPTLNTMRLQQHPKPNLTFLSFPYTEYVFT